MFRYVEIARSGRAFLSVPVTLDAVDFRDGAGAVPVGRADLVDTTDLGPPVMLKFGAAVWDRAHVEILFAEIHGDLCSWPLQVDAPPEAHAPPKAAGLPRWRHAGSAAPCEGYSLRGRLPRLLGFPVRPHLPLSHARSPCLKV